MTKYEFLERLDLLLTDLPQEERMDAIWYYEDYFADAGPENEEQVLRELGSPESVAEKIRAGFRQTGAEPSEGQMENKYEENAYSEASAARREVHSKSSIRPLLALLILIFFGFPVVLPIVLTLFAVLFVFFLAFGISGVAMVAAGVVLAASCTANIVFGAGVAMLCAGAGLIVAALGLLFIVFAVNCAFRAAPAIIRGSVSFVRRLLFGKEVRYEAI